MARWSRIDWVDHALTQLARHGPEGITIDALCTSAKRTRGSLYHHFAEHDELLRAVVDHWRERYTEALIREVDAAGLDGATSASRLNDLATALDFDVEVGVRRLAASRPWIREAVHAADRQRISYLASLWRRQGVSTKDARVLAELEYAAFVGVQHLSPLFTARRLGELYRRFDALMRK